MEKPHDEETATGAVRVTRDPLDPGNPDDDDCIQGSTTRRTRSGLCTCARPRAMIGDLWKAGEMIWMERSYLYVLNTILLLVLSTHRLNSACSRLVSSRQP